MKLKIIVLLFAISGVLSCRSGKTVTITNSAQLDTQLKKIESRSVLPGFAVAIVNAQGVLYQKGFGYANLKNKTPYTPETIQPIGSISKTFIAIAIQKAIEQGYFTLETHVDDLLPFKVIHPLFPDKKITIRHLVTHTSGLVDEEANYLKTYQYNKKPTVSLGDYLMDYLTQNGKLYKPENFSKQAPGTEYNYSNIGSALAAYLIEVKTSMPYDTYIKQTILSPLHMQDSHWFYDNTKEDRYASLYNVSNKPYDFYSLITYPDGGLRTSCRDLSAYLVEMIKGYHQQGSLLTKKSYQSMFSPKFVPDQKPMGFPEKYNNQGVFWVINRSGRLLHTGGDPGLSTFMSFDPVSQTGRILLTNTEVEESEKALKQVKEITELLQNFESQLK